MTARSDGGTRYAPTSVLVDAAHVRRFADSLDADPSVIPPTYAAVYAVDYTMAQALADEDLRIDFARMVHGEQEFTWSDPPRAGEILTVVVDLVSDETRGALRFVTLSADIRGGDGRAVCGSRSVLVVR